MKMHVIGDPDAVLGFSLAGLTGEVATTAHEVVQALDRAVGDPEMGVILITEQAASLVEELVASLRVATPGPVVIEIPGPEGPMRERPSMREVAMRATGTRV